MAYASPPKTSADQQASAAQLHTSPSMVGFSDDREALVDTLQLQELMGASPIHQQARALTQLMAKPVLNADAITFKNMALPAVATQLKGVIQLHKGSNNYDDALDDIIIYVVMKKIGEKVVYVGQTEEAVGISKRFEQHQNVHDWPSSTHKIVRREAGSWTRLEASCAEQYWIDHYGFENLENDRNQITRAHFIELMEWADENDVTIFRGEDIGFPRGWKPKN